MPLQAGSRIGHFEVTALIGEGAMGQVYRATDTKLHREVALKILPEVFAGDHDRLDRFQQEARSLAALSHPGIAAIYGTEEADGIHALVLELVAGPTLEDRIARGPIPPAEALRLADGIAAALEAAHEQGIIHRDLKPANIKIKDDGTVKVLDFGLAKALRPALTQEMALGSDVATLQETTPGMILGTAAYMSPEQARAEPVDGRTDVWAFGCVLYEMLTGRRLVGGARPHEILANVLTQEPDFSALPAATPALARRLLHRCLEKDRRRRLRHIGDARDDLRDSLSPSGAMLQAGPPASELPPQPVTARRRFAMAAAVLAIVVAAGLAGWLAASRGTDEEPAPAVVTFEIAGISGAGFDRTILISPDGKHVVHPSGNGLTLRSLAHSNLVQLQWEGDTPFFSPDGQWIGYFSGFTKELGRVPVQGGAPAIVASLGIDARPHGADWGPDDDIVFATSIGLYRVPAEGGEPELLAASDTDRGELYFGWPEILPDGRNVLFSVVQKGAVQIAALDLETRKRRIVVPDGLGARYLPSGHLVYVAQRRLEAVAFDPIAVEVRGAPEGFADVAVADANFDVADSGTLVYLAPGTSGPMTLVWLDREGREEPLPGLSPEAGLFYPRISPDGKRVAGDRRGPDGRDIYIWDLERKNLSRVTDEPGEEVFATWSHDGRRLFYSANRSGPFNIYSRAADGTGTAERVSESPATQMIMGSTPDGAVLLVGQAGPGVFDIAAIDVAGAGTARTLLGTEVNERQPSVSPDGRWVAYSSNVEGRFEVYVGPYPDLGSRRFKISKEGGDTPLWSRRGDEIFFRSPTGATMAASVTLTPTTFEPGEVTELFPAPGGVSLFGVSGRIYDVSPIDGRFLMTKMAPAPGSALMVVLNWARKLESKVPAGGSSR